MKIKQVEELVGITSKNIRFYEEQGLLQPRRTENGYRDYRTEDVELLKKIKLFRKLGVPVEQIHRLFQGQISVDECLENQKAVLQKEQDNIEKMCTLSQAMLAGSLSIEKLDSDYWLDKVEKMEKEGIDFVSKVDIHMKKKLGVFGGAGIMLILMLLVIGVLIYGYVVDADMPLWALTLVIVPIVAVIVGTIVAMVSRIKEIDKGEEDEAAKY